MCFCLQAKLKDTHAELDASTQGNEGGDDEDDEEEGGEEKNGDDAKNE